jgi:hypothetical protein
MKGTSLVRAVVIGVVACGAVPVPALAGGPPPPAIAQYVETAPSAGGATVTGYGKAHVRKLPRGVVQEIERQAEPAAAAALKTVATSSQFGAPQSTLHLYRQHRPEQPTKANGGSARSAAPASATLTNGSGSGSLVGLGVVLALLTAVMSAVGLRNR